MPLDIGIGLIIGVIVSSLSGLNYGLCLTLGVLASLSPDLDYIWKIIQTRHLPHSEHRDSLHYPLIVVPLLGLIGLLVNPYIGMILFLGTLSHFIHDSIGIGFGIKWLYPFNKNSYLFLFQIKTPSNNDMPKQRLYSWSDKERAKTMSKYAYPGWIKFVYFQYNPWGVFEYSVFILGIIVSILGRP